MGEIGINKGTFDHTIKLGDKVAQAKSREEAHIKAQIHPGSEIIYEKEGHWEVQAVSEKGTLWGQNALEVEDQSQFQLDPKALNAQGIKEPVFSFVEEDLSKNQKRALAQNTETTPATLETLAKDETRKLRLPLPFTAPGNLLIKADVAQNPNTAPATLLELAAHSEDEDVVAALASNPHTPAEALLLLANQGHQTAVHLSAAALAGHKNATAEALDALLKVSPATKHNILTHPNASEKTLKILSQDTDPQIAKAAALRLHDLNKK